MSEYRTKPLDQTSLKAELEAVCEALNKAGVTDASVSFGWDCNLDVEEMWKDQTVGLPCLAGR